MVNGSLCNFSSHSHTHSLMTAAAMRGASLITKSNLRLSVLQKDT